MQFLRVIEWVDQDEDTIVHKMNIPENSVNRGSVLNVRESQVAIFCDNGRVADVFLPGYYKLDTDSIPVLTRLLSWKYGFEKPFKSDIYFVSTRQFIDQKWGTATPFMIRDKDYGGVRLRAYGTYAYRVKDAFAFMKELSGTLPSFTTRSIGNHIRSMLVMGIADVIGESGISVLDMAANLLELSAAVCERLAPRFAAWGMELCAFHFESISLPPELEKTLDENTRLGILGKNIDVYTRLAQADALREAAKNTGAAGGAMGAGIGMGVGMSMGQMFTDTNAPSKAALQSTSREEGKVCAKCGKTIAADAKFCPFCGEAIAVASVCPKCGTKLPPDAKFCSACGYKIS